MGQTIKKIIRGGVIENQVLLLGVEGQGKTRFLYENHVQGKNQLNLNKSYGYNYEQILYDGNEIAIWDLAGSEEQLWNVFINTVPFTSIGFIVRPYKESKNESKIDLESIAQSRKLLHFIANEFIVCDKILLVILNVPLKIIKSDENETEEEGKNKIKDQLKDLLMWEQLPQNIKDIVIIDVSFYQEYDLVWKAQLQLFQEYKQIKEKETKKQI